MRGGFDQRRAIAVQRYPRFCWPPPMRIDRCGHTLPDEISPIAHRTRLRRALLPAKACCPFGQAFAHIARGERPSAVRVGIAVVSQAQLDRVDAGRIRQLIHRAFESEMTLWLVLIPPLARHRWRLAMAAYST